MRTVALVLCVIAPSISAAQQSPPPNAPAFALAGSAFALSVSDVAASERWYKDNIDVHGIVKVGIVVDDFDKTLETLRARGVTIFMGPWPKRPDQPANVLVKDNEGNLIQFIGT